MIRIIITAEAYSAISGSEPPDSARAPRSDGYGLWLEPLVVAKLKAARGPGESFSDVILKLAEAESA